MIWKLAWRNGKRQLKDYLVYIVTISFTASLLFAFNLVAYDSKLLALIKTFDMVQLTFIIVLIPISLIICWLNNYMARFLFEKRSREFGIYMLQGIPRSKIALIYILENFIIQVFSFLIALLLGYYFYQILIAILLNFYDIEYKINFNISKDALLITLLSFSSVLFLNFLFNFKRMFKIKIAKILVAKKSSEKRIKHDGLIKFFIFIIANFMIFVPLFFLKSYLKDFNFVVDKHKAEKIIWSIVSVLTGIFLFYYSFSSIFSFILQYPKIKYRGNNLFLSRLISSKLKMLGTTFGFLGLVLALSFSLMNAGTMFNRLFDHAIDTISPTQFFVDCSVSEEIGLDYENQFIVHFKKTYAPEKDAIVNYFRGESEDIDRIVGSSDLGSSSTIIFESDYNKIRDIQNKSHINLGPNQFMISTSVYGLEKEIKINHEYNLIDRQATLVGYSYTDLYYYGDNYIYIVDDDFARDLPFRTAVYFADTAITTTQLKELRDYIKNDYYYMRSYLDSKEDAVTWKILIILGSYYFGIVIFAIAFSIFSVQQLYESMRNKANYRNLALLGLKNKEINSIIIKQLLLYFLLPMIIPLIVSYLINLTVTNFFYYYIAPGSNLVSYLFVIGLFLIISTIYLVATYISFNKNIKKA